MKVRISEQEFEKIYQLYSQELFNVAYGYTRNVNDSEDIVQNAFVKFLKSNQIFNTYNDLKYWLIRVTINESINLVKSSYKKKVILNEELIMLSKDETTSNDDLMLEPFIDMLPEKYKQVIILFYYDKLKTKEISELLMINESAVRKRLERARELLKKKMEVVDR